MDDVKSLISKIIIILFLFLLFIPSGVAFADDGDEPFVIPETIRVRITGDETCDGKFSHVEIIDFKEYVKGVLAAEWGNRWHVNSLKAGAVAVKMFAIDAINQDGKWGAMPWAQDRVADVYDCNWDQVYKPEWRTAKSDQAVDDTWNNFLRYENGDPFPAYFKAWDFGCSIANEKGECMGQWNV